MTARTLASSGALASSDASPTGGVPPSPPEEPVPDPLLVPLDAPLLPLPLPLEVVAPAPSSPAMPELDAVPPADPSTPTVAGLVLPRPAHPRGAARARAARATECVSEGRGCTTKAPLGGWLETLV